MRLWGVFSTINSAASSANAVMNGNFVHCISKIQILYR
jgi:hypothetical protein